MRVYGVRSRVVELQMRAKRGKGWCVSSFELPVFSFLLDEREQHRKWWGVASLFWNRCSRESKANSRSRWVCLLGEVLDFGDRKSCETVSEMFGFCDNVSWDVAQLLLRGVIICTRSSNGFWRDGGKMFLFRKLWNTEDAHLMLLCFKHFHSFVNYLWSKCEA